MKKIFIQNKFYLILVYVFSVFGCSTTQGQKFEKPLELTELKIGSDFYHEVKQLGNIMPDEEITLEKGIPIRKLTYTFFKTEGDRDFFQIMVCYFNNEKLVGYEYLSSLKEDQKNFPGFEIEKVEEIKEGKTSLNNVNYIMRTPPHGKFIYPLANNKEIIITYYDPSVKNRLKKLLLIIDNRKLVRFRQFSDKSTKKRFGLKGASL